MFDCSQARAQTACRAEGHRRDHPRHRPRSRQHRLGRDRARRHPLALLGVRMRHDPRRRGPGAAALAVYDEIGAVIARYRPAEAAVESVFFGTNAKSAFATGQARGVALLATADAGSRSASTACRSSTPSSARRRRQGQVQYMVRAILGLAHEPRPDHAADALAAAICHAHTARRRRSERRPRPQPQARGTARRRRDDRLSDRPGRGEGADACAVWTSAASATSSP